MKVAAIVGKDSSVRVVVTPESHILFHVNEGEKAYIVPDIVLSQQPSPDQYPAIVARAMEYVKAHAS